MHSLRLLDPVVIVQNTSENNDALLMRILQLQSVSARVRTADGAETIIRLSVDGMCRTARSTADRCLCRRRIRRARNDRLPGRLRMRGSYTTHAAASGPCRAPGQSGRSDKGRCVDRRRTRKCIATGSDLFASISTNLPGLWSCYDASHTLYQANICWNTDSVNTTTPGLYWLTGTLAAPAHTVFSETLAVPVLRVPISVQDPKHPDINFIFPARGQLCIPIAGLPGNTAPIRIRLCTHDGIWQGYRRIPAHCRTSSDAIYLSNFLFTPQETYKLQVTYEGGKTGILTFLFDETLEHFQYSGGGTAMAATPTPERRMTGSSPHRNCRKQSKPNRNCRKRSKPNRNFRKRSKPSRKCRTPPRQRQT